MNLTLSCSPSSGGIFYPTFSKTILEHPLPFIGLFYILTLPPFCHATLSPLISKIYWSIWYFVHRLIFYSKTHDQLDFFFIIYGDNIAKTWLPNLLNLLNLKDFQCHSTLAIDNQVSSNWSLFQSTLKKLRNINTPISDFHLLYITPFFSLRYSYWIYCLTYGNF